MSSTLAQHYPHIGQRLVFAGWCLLVNHPNGELMLIQCHTMVNQHQHNVHSDFSSEQDPATNYIKCIITKIGSHCVTKIDLC